MNADQTTFLTDLITNTLAKAEEFEARHEASRAWGSVICEKPWVVVDDLCALALHVKGGTYTPVSVQPHLCGMSTFSREAAEIVCASRLEHNPTGGWQIVQHRDLASLRAKQLRAVAATMQEVFDVPFRSH